MTKSTTEIEPATTGRRMTYQPALDGLRALAVGAVMLYHHLDLGRRGLGRGGFVGVDIFFVLSGFLITSLLVAEYRDSGSVKLRRFWARRARRLIPAFLAMLVLVAVLTRSVYPESLAPLIRDDVRWSLVYLQNWHLAVFDGSMGSPISHTWSLSVEEQWYLLWPAILGLILGWTKGRTRTVTSVLLGLAVASSLWTVYLFNADGGRRAYFGTDTRAQELLIGAALGVLASGSGLILGRRARRLVQPISVAALLGLGVVVLGIGSGPGWYHGGFLALALATAVVITAAVQPLGAVRAVLGVSPLVALGRWSYGLYLFHLPVYRWLSKAEVGLEGLPLLAVRVAVTTAIAAASFRFLEQPIRHGRFSGRRLLVIGAIVAAAVIAATTIGVAKSDPEPRSDLLALVLRDTADEAPANAIRVLVVGGSGASLLGGAMNGPYSGRGLWGMSIGTFGCGLTSGGRSCRAVPDDLRALAGTFRADAVVLMPDEGDLTDFSMNDDSMRGPDQVVVRLDRMRDAVDDRRLFVLAVPCSPNPAARGAFNDVVQDWARRRTVPFEEPGATTCPSGGRSETTPMQVWESIAALVRPVNPG